MGGYNNNPNYIQFASAYKRLFHHNEVKSSAQANCIAISNISILTVSSSAKKICMTHDETNISEDENILFDDISLEYIDGILYHAVLQVLSNINC